MELILGAAAKIVKPRIKCYEESKYCCEVFGIDFMITDDYIVKLIEINAEVGIMRTNISEVLEITVSQFGPIGLLNYTLLILLLSNCPE